MCERLEILEQSLVNLKAKNKTMWDTYGSELCAGQMIREEEILQEKINKLKEELENDKI